MKSPSLLFLLAVVFLITGCGPSCYEGDSFIDPQLVGGIELIEIDGDQKSQIRISWSSPTETITSQLTEEYYQAARLAIYYPFEPFTVNEYSESVSLSGQNEYTIVFNQIIGEPNQEVFLALELPDRMGFTDCYHICAPDQYYLSISISFDEYGVVSSVIFGEQIDLAGYC